MVSFLKISENHEKICGKSRFLKLNFTFRIRIQPGNLNPDPPGSETLGTSMYVGMYLPVVYRVPGVKDLEEEGERLHRRVEVHHVDQLVHCF